MVVGNDPSDLLYMQIHTWYISALYLVYVHVPATKCTRLALLYMLDLSCRYLLCELKAFFCYCPHKSKFQLRYPSPYCMYVYVCTCRYYMYMHVMPSYTMQYCTLNDSCHRLSSFHKRYTELGSLYMHSPNNLSCYMYMHVDPVFTDK